MIVVIAPQAEEDSVKTEEEENSEWERERAASLAEYEAQQAAYKAKPNVRFHTAKFLRADKKPSAIITDGDVEVAPFENPYNQPIFHIIHNATFSYQRSKFCCGVALNKWQPRVEEKGNGVLVAHHSFKKTQEWVKRVTEMRVEL